MGEGIGTAERRKERRAGKVPPKELPLDFVDPEAAARYAALRARAVAGFEPDAAHWSKDEILEVLADAPPEHVTAQEWREYAGLGDAAVLEAMRARLDAAADMVRRAEKWHAAVEEAVRQAVAADPGRNGPLADGWGTAALKGRDGIVKTICVAIASAKYDGAGYILNDAVRRTVTAVLDAEAERRRSLEVEAWGEPTGAVESIDLVLREHWIGEPVKGQLKTQVQTDGQTVGRGPAMLYWEDLAMTKRGPYLATVYCEAAWGSDDITLIDVIYGIQMERHRRWWERNRPGEPHPAVLKSWMLPYEDVFRVSDIAKVYCGTDKPTTDDLKDVAEKIRKARASTITLDPLEDSPALNDGGKDLEDYRPMLNCRIVEEPHARTRLGAPVVQVDRMYMTRSLPYYSWAMARLGYATRLKTDYLRIPKMTAGELKERCPQAWAKAEELDLFKDGKKGRYLGMKADSDCRRMMSGVRYILGLGGNKSVRKYRTMIPEYGREGVYLPMDDLLESWRFGEEERIDLVKARREHGDDIPRYLLYLMMYGAVLDFIPRVGRRGRTVTIDVVLPNELDGDSFYMAPDLRKVGP